MFNFAKKTLELTPNEHLRENYHEKKLDPEFDQKLLDFVKKVYSSRSDNISSINANLEHTRHVLTKSLEIAEHLVQHPEEDNLTALKHDLTHQNLPMLSFNHLRTMAILHDIAKIGKDGNIDTYNHHNPEVVKEILENSNTTIEINHKKTDLLSFFAANGFTQEDITEIIDAIHRHSTATQFIRKNETKMQINAGRIKKDRPKNLRPAILMPTGKGSLESAILSDADLINQTALHEGFKKIVFLRLSSDLFYSSDQKKEKNSEGNEKNMHDISKTIESARLSAEEALNNLNFQVSRDEAKHNYRQIEAFVKRLEDDGEIKIINQIQEKDKKREYLLRLIDNFQI